MRLFLAFIVSLSMNAYARPIEVHGHRGARGYFPENTLPAFAHALKAGVDVIELDTGISKNDKVIILHDALVNPARCLDKNGQTITTEIVVHDTNLKELKEFDCGSLKHPDFPKQTLVPKTPMPTLDEFFEFIKNSELPSSKTVRFNIETKINPNKPELYTTPENFAKRVYNVIKKHKMEKRVILQSFDPRTLIEFRKLDKKLVISVLLHKDPGNVVKVARESSANIISPNFEWIKEKHIQDLKAIGVTVIPYTVDEESQWKELIKIGVTGIITDYPDDLIKYLEKN